MQYIKPVYFNCIIKEPIWEILTPLCILFPWTSFSFFFFFLFVVNFVVHWNETAMGLHVFPIPIPRPTSLSTRSL